MKICFIPIDNRPVCYNLPQDIAAIDKDIELFVPPIEFLGDLTKPADTDSLYQWFLQLPDMDAYVLSLDTLAYGGLIPSRKISASFEEIKLGIERFKPFLEGKKVYAFSSIMRISNNNCNEEEKEYWNDWGKEIFKFSYESCRLHKTQETDVPIEILEDYLITRKRNFAINALYVEWQNEGLFDTLIFSKDDCAEFGFNVSEAIMLENIGGKTKTGADEIPLTLLARAIEKEIKIYPMFIEPKQKHKISNYEDISVEDSLLGQLELGGFKVAKSKKSADIILIVNNFIEKQGEHVMGWETKPFGRKFVPPSKPYTVADIRYANGSDNDFMKEMLKNAYPEYGYAGWNTSANTIGSLISSIKIKYNAKNYDDYAFKKLQAIRLLDDWAYQANVRRQIEDVCSIKKLMEPYEHKIKDILKIDVQNISYEFPWNRKFEIKVKI